MGLFDKLNLNNFKSLGMSSNNSTASATDDMSKGDFNELRQGYKQDFSSSNSSILGNKMANAFGMKQDNSSPNAFSGGSFLGDAMANFSNKMPNKAPAPVPGAATPGNADGSGSMQINGENYAVQKQNSGPSSNGTGSARSNFNNISANRIQGASMGNKKIIKDLIPDSKLRNKTTINTSEKTKGNKSKYKEKYRDTIEVHDIEGDKKGVKNYIDTSSKTKGNKEKRKQFFSDGTRGSLQKQKTGGKLRERRTTKGGTKRRIEKAEENLKDSKK